MGAGFRAIQPEYGGIAVQRQIEGVDTVDFIRLQSRVLNRAFLSRPFNPARAATRPPVTATAQAVAGAVRNPFVSRHCLPREEASYSSHRPVTGSFQYTPGVCNFSTSPRLQRVSDGMLYCIIPPSGQRIHSRISWQAQNLHRVPSGLFSDRRVQFGLADCSTFFKEQSPNRGESGVTSRGRDPYI